MKNCKRELNSRKNIPIHINGVRLSQDQMKSLKAIYPNLTITNRQYKDQEVANRFGVSVDDVARCRHAISRGFKADCRWWMDFIVVEGRISWLLNTVKTTNTEWYLHIDIDLFFRDSIQPLIDKIYENDVVLRFRPDRNFVKANGNPTPEPMRIAGGMVGLSKQSAIPFVEKWREEIFKVKGHGIKGRDQAWGQTTLYYAYNHFKDEYKWGEIGAEWLTASCNVKNPIWCGHKKGRVMYNGVTRSIPDRTKFRDIFFEELAKMEKK